MLFGQLVAEIVREGETVEEALDREARAIILASRADRLVPLLGDLRGFDLTDRPFAQILVGLVANASLPKDVELTFAMLDGAASTFAARGDREGEALASWVRGNVLLGLGDLVGASRAWHRAIELAPDTALVEDLSLANLAYAAYCSDGDIPVALELADAAADVARARSDARSEGLALVYASLMLLHAGRFGDAEDALGRADTAFGSQPEPAYEWPLVFAGMGVLAGIRGRAEAADTAFLRGIMLARQLQNRWYEAIVRVLRADHTVAFDSRRAHTDCRWAQRVFDEVSDTWWGATARRVRADAALASGEVEAARRLSDALLTRLEHPVERARCLITSGRAYARCAEADTAAARADEAVRLVEPTGADFITVQALMLVAECERWRAPDAIEQARELTGDDPGWVALWAARPSLRIEVLGRRVVAIGSEPVEFRTSRSEHLVLMLALAGGRGVEADDVSGALWPGADATKLPSNLSTATYDARQALGTESWRLHRAGTRFWLDLDGAFVDLHDAMQRAQEGRAAATPDDEREITDRQAAIERLRQAILPTLAFEPWVVDANRRREAFLGVLGAADDPRSTDAPGRPTTPDVPDAPDR